MTMPPFSRNGLPRPASAGRVEVAVLGAGQAGLSLSHELTEAGVEHVVLERGRVGQAWRDRWDSFCLVIPNWTVQLPGGRYQGGEPDGFMPRDDIVAHLDRYALSFRAPAHEGISVSWLGRVTMARSFWTRRQARSAPSRWSWPPAATSVRTAAARWLATKRPSTADLYASELRNHVLPAFAARPPATPSTRRSAATKEAPWHVDYC
jgi:choline dehydrogenase-like flavoprotein